MSNLFFAHPFKAILCLILYPTTRKQFIENVHSAWVVKKFQFNIVAIRLMQRFV